MGVGELVGEEPRVDVALSVRVDVGEGVTDGEGVMLGVPDADGAGGEGVTDGVGVWLGVAVREYDGKLLAVCGPVGVGTPEGEPEPEALDDGLPAADGLAEPVGEPDLDRGLVAVAEMVVLAE